MTIRSRAELLAEINIIKNEAAGGGNTRVRVANTLLDIADSLVAIGEPAVSLNGTPVSSVNTDGSLDATTAAGVATVKLPGTTTAISETPIVGASGAQTLWSYACPVSSSLRVEALLDCTCNDGNTGKQLTGALVCTAKRVGSGALAITSQSAALPWRLDDATWLPQFDTSSNTLRLRLTADASNTIQPRGTVRLQVTDTSGDAVPVFYDFASIFAQMVSLSNGKLIEQFELTNTGCTGRNGHVMTSIGGGTYTNTTMGANARSAITATSGIAGCLRCADVGQAVKALLTVCQVPVFPDATNYQVLMGTGTANSPTNKTMVQSTISTLYVDSWSRYINNTLTNVFPSAGSQARILAELSANTDQSVQVGYTTANFAWREKQSVVWAFNAVLTSGEKLAIDSFLAGAF